MHVAATPQTIRQASVNYTHRLPTQINTHQACTPTHTSTQTPRTYNNETQTQRTHPSRSACARTQGCHTFLRY